MDYKNYVKVLLGTLTIFIFIIIALAVVIDPFGLYRIIQIRGFNYSKWNQVKTRLHFVKSLEVIKRDSNLIFLGNSRTGMGMNPQDDAIPKKYRSYNMGLPGLRVYEAYHYLKYIVNHLKIERVVFGVDFIMFNQYQLHGPSFDLNLLQTAFPLYRLSKAVLSKTVVNAMVENLIENNKNPNGPYYGPLGLSISPDINSNKWDQINPEIHRLMNNPEYYKSFKLQDRFFQYYEKIIQLCQDNGIELDVFFSPSHAIQWMAVEQSGNWNNFELWKKKIMQINLKYHLKILDFAQVNQYSSQDIDTSPFYHDNSHFSSELGHLINSIIFHKEDISDFGIYLNKENIENVLNEQKKKLFDFTRNHPQFVTLLKNAQIH